MLAKKQKIPKKLFGEVIKLGRNFHSPNLSLKLLRALAGKKFSFVISKKVSPLAVKRNLLKRRGFAVIKKILGEIKEPATGIIFLKSSAKELNFSQMEKEIVKLFSEAGLLTGDLEKPKK